MNKRSTYRVKDGGHGITVKSLVLWQQFKRQLDGRGGPGMIKISYREMDLSCDPDLNVTDAIYTFLLRSKDGSFAILLSGCNCGYGGEGPRGSAEILEDLGLGKKYELLEKISGAETVEITYTDVGSTLWNIIPR